MLICSDKLQYCRPCEQRAAQPMQNVLLLLLQRRKVESFRSKSLTAPRHRNRPNQKSTDLCHFWSALLLLANFPTLRTNNLQQKQHHGNPRRRTFHPTPSKAWSAVGGQGLFGSSSFGIPVSIFNDLIYILWHPPNIFLISLINSPPSPHYIILKWILLHLLPPKLNLQYYCWCQRSFGYSRQCKAP